MSEKTPEQFLVDMQRIYEEREDEYKKRDDAYRQKKEGLQLLLKSIEQKKEELDGRTEKIEQQETSATRQRQELSEKEERLTEKEKALEEKEKELVMKHNLELEDIRNEKIKLQRLTEEYEYKMGMADAGIKGMEYIQMPNMDTYVSRESYEEEKAEWEKKMSDMVRQVEVLQEERGQLFRTIVEQTQQKEDRKTPQVEEMKSATPIPQPVELSKEEEITQEDMNAEILKGYIEKNLQEYKNLQIFHAEAGEQLQAEVGELTLRVLFGEPSSFDLIAKRKHHHALKKILAQCNEKFPGVQFRYDEKEASVYATGYFACNMKTYELMERVNEISECFNVKG